MHKGAKYAVLAAFSFGVATPSMKIGADNVPVFLYNLLMVVVATTALGIYFIIKERGRSWHVRKLWKEYLLIGVVSGFIPNIFVYLGYRYSYAVNATVLLRFEVFVVLLFGVWFLKEKISFRQVWGLILGGVGIGVFVFKGGISISWGDVFILIAATLYALYPILTKRLQRILSVTQINIMRVAVPIPLFTVIVFLTDQTAILTYGKGIPHIAIGSLVVLALGASFYGTAVVHWDAWKAVFVAQFGSVFIGYVTSARILGESFSLQQYIASVVILTSLVLVLWKSKKRVAVSV
jgi:drug/metabolite transporter (DMT)-like permease